MAINPNNGVLDIINGTLKVSSIDIKQAAGFTTALNTVARNDVLLFDDQKATTVFTPTSEGGYMSSTGVTRDTTGGAGYIDLNDGWVYWPLQLPNSWHTEFDMHVTTTGGVLTFSLFNTSEPNHTDYTNNDGGYKIVFDNTNNQIDIYWEGSIHKTVGANLRSSDWQHVNINYFQGAISVSLAGKVVLTHEFTQNYQEFNSRYVGFSATAGASHKIRHLRVHNSDKWLYTKTSNASDITYVSGNVGIGTLTPTELLDVHGNVHIAKDLTVNGNLTVSGTTTFIDTQNLAIEDPIIEVAKGNASDTIDAGLVITRATSNVAVAYRGDEEELALGYTQSGASDTDVTPITDGGLDVRVYGNLFANNLTTTANVEATYLKGDGSELTQVTLDQVVGYGNVTSNTIQLAGLTATGNVEANYFIGNGSKLTGLVTDLQSVTDNGNVTSNTVQFTNATTAFVADSNVGIGTDTPTANLHVVGHQYVNDPPTIANSFDHSDAPLTLTHGTPTSTTAIDDPKAVLHLTRDGTSGESYGARASFNLSRYENSGTASRSRLDVALTDGTYAETNVMSIRADGKVGIGTDTPAYTLDVAGDINLSGDFYQGGSPFVSSLWTDGTDSLYYRSNVEVGTANLFVDTMTGNVGVGTNSPGFSLDVHGTANVGALTATSISGPLSGNADTATALETARTIGGVSFDGSGNIDLPGVNTTGNQNTSGNAATATALETARTIGGVSFDGTANIDLPGVNTTGNQDTTGNADTATTATNQSGGTVNATTGTFSGNVGIGTTSPGGKLDVVASSEGNYIARFKNSSVASDQDARIVIDASDAGGESQILLQTTDELTTHKWNITAGSGITPSLGFQYDSNFNGGTFAMNILHGGNVGIGTTSPSYKLNVLTDTNYDGISLRDSTRELLKIAKGNNGAYINMFESSVSKVNISTAGNSWLNGGNVGIGTTSPGYKLDVNGTLHAGNSYFDNVYIGGSTSRGLRAVSGAFGTVQTTGGGAGGWEGYSIDGRYVFMSDTDNRCGIYNDVDNEWMIYCARNNYVKLYYNGSERLATNNAGASVTGRLTSTGALKIGVGGNDDGYMTNSGGSGRKNLWIQSTYGGNTSQNYGWWIGAQNQGLSSSDNDLYFAVVRNGTITLPAFVQDSTGHTQMNFTGQHRTFVKGVPIQQLEDKEGLIVSADQNDFIRMNGGIARGNEAITTNESLPIVSFSTKSNDKKCFGVVSTTEDPENRVEVYGNFASNMRKEVGDTRVYINSVGEGAVWVTDINGPLESGDYITTSNVAGYGMRQEDDILHNYTVAKITMDCDFNPVTQPVQIIKKELANVDYWIDYATSEIKQEEYETLPENEREIREDKYYKIYKREIQKTNPENDKFVHEVYEELVNVLDEHGQLQWENHPTDMEKAYKIRYLDTSGQITDEANAVHIAAFVGCTYHCG